MRAVVLGIFVVAACGTGRPASVIDQATEPPPTILTSATSADVRLSADNRAIDGLVPAPADSTWKALVSAWETMKIPIRDASPATGTLRSPRFRVPGRIADKPIRDFFDCGVSAAGPRADLWDVHIEVTSAIRVVNPRQSRLSSAIIATARPRDGTGTNTVPCATWGLLEKMILQYVQSGGA